MTAPSRTDAAGDSFVRRAGRNLIFSIFAEHLGFSVWALWSVIVVALPPKSFPFILDVDKKFWLVAIPNLVGAVLRLPYTLPAGVHLYREQFVSGVSAATLSPPRRDKLLDHKLRSERDANDLVKQLELGQLQR